MWVMSAPRAPSSSTAARFSTGIGGSITLPRSRCSGWGLSVSAYAGSPPACASCAPIRRCAMSSAAVILRNVAVNWIGFAVNACVTLILTPFVLRELGAAAYGVWVLTSSVIGYYGLLDLGLRGGVTQFLTRYLAVEDLRSASECMSSALAALSVVCLAVLLLTAGMAYGAPHIFRIPAAMRAEASWCIAIVGCAGALQFLLFPFAAVFTATQRFDLANAI